MPHSKSKAEVKAIADSIYNQPLSPKEFEERLVAAMTPEQNEERKALIAWFTCRYPTPMERLKYVTARSRQWLGK